MVENENEIDKLRFNLYKSRGCYAALCFDEWIKLKQKEKKIVARSKLENISLEEIFEDVCHVGDEKVQVFKKAFLNNTREKSRTASVSGYRGLVVYFARGTFLSDPKYELGILSAHSPGSPSQDRLHKAAVKMQLVKGKYKKNVEPEKWIENTVAYAYLNPKKELHHDSSVDPAYRTIMRLIVDNAGK